QRRQVNAHVALAELCRLALLDEALDAPARHVVELDEAERHAAIGVTEHLSLDVERRRAVAQIDLEVHLRARIELLVGREEDAARGQIDGAAPVALANLHCRIVSYTRRIDRTHGLLPTQVAFPPLSTPNPLKSGR